MTDEKPRDFIREIVAADVAAGLHGGRVVTRFPPEPNGYLHIGHAKAICLDFGIAEEFGGVCHLRMDDTNPETEDPRYVEAIARDVRWLGFEWEGPIRYASDYFESFYRLAEQLIRDGRAYVDSHSEEEIRELRGTVRTPGRPGAYRDRSVEENLELFRRMRAGEFADGEHVLRAKIDLASPNMKMRDPLLYRIRHATHYRTGDAWPVYPMYDWAHPLSDALEGVTHSLCTLEFENNRELYDWVVEHTRPSVVGMGSSDAPGAWDPRPRQYEFARLNLDYTVMSKRKLLRLVEEGRVSGWDDPRMPTLAGLRRRGVPPEAIRAFCDRIGVARADNRVDIGKLEYAVRDFLNPRAPRVLCVLDPLRVVVENFPEGTVEWLEAPYFPRDVERPPPDWPATRRLPFSRELYIEREDFREDPPSGFRRLAPGREVRLRYGYFLRCESVVHDETGRVVELRCTYDPETRGGTSADGRRVQGTIHWVSAEHGVPCEVRLYDRLFRVPDPEQGDGDFVETLNPDSLELRPEARIEPSVAEDPPDTAYQFERQGYFVRDPEPAADGRPVFNRTVALRDSWARRPPRREEPGAGAPPVRDPTGARASGSTGGTDRLRGLGPEAADRASRYMEEWELPAEDAAILAEEGEWGAWCERAVEAGADPATAANWVIHELRGLAGDRSPGALPIGGETLAELLELLEEGTISQRTAKDLLRELVERGGSPRAIVRERGLEQIATEAELAPIVERVLEEHAEQVERFRAGQQGLLGFFVGQAMRETDGRADPQLLQRLLRDRLERTSPKG